MKIRLIMRWTVILCGLFWGTHARAQVVSWSAAEGDWETASNWSPAGVPGASSQVYLANGGTLLLHSDAGVLSRFYPWYGTLTMTGAATLQVSANDTPIYLGTNTVAATMNLYGGAFTAWGNNNNTHFHIGFAGGTGALLIGDGAQTATMQVDKDIIIGSGTGAKGSIEIRQNGSLMSSNGWIYVGHNLGQGVLTITGGSLVPRGSVPALVLGHGGGSGIVTQNLGSVILGEQIRFSDSTGVASSYGEYHFNGGTLETRFIWTEKTTGKSYFYFNGGTLRNKSTYTSGNFIYSLTAAYVQSGGAAIEIIAGSSLTIPQGLWHDPASGAIDGGLTKLGRGALTLTGSNTITGPLSVDSGSLVLNHANGLPSGYASSVRIQNNALLGVQQSTAVAQALLQNLTDDSVGTFCLYPATASVSVDFSNKPGMKLAFANGVTYSGTYTPSGSVIVFAPQSGTNSYAAAITGEVAVEVRGERAGTLKLSGANSYSGGTKIYGGRLWVDSLSTLGTGSVELLDGGILVLNDAAATSSFVQDRLVAGSRGILALGPNCARLSLDLTGYPNLYVGTTENYLYHSGIVTPADDTYRLAGVGTVFRVQPYRGLIATNLIDNGAIPRNVLIEGDGVVTLLPGNNTLFTGQIIVTNKGALFLRGDLSAAPAYEQADNIYVSGGAIRSGDIWFTVHPNRGMRVGPDGMELHPWGANMMTIGGNLSGTGLVYTTDGGFVSFGGTNNTFNGVLDIRSSATVAVGSGTFQPSWNPDAQITNSTTAYGYWGINTDGTYAWSSIFNKVVSNTYLGFRKLGSGTVVMDVNQLYGGDTIVQAGTLKMGCTNALPYGTGKRGLQLTVPANTVFDLNGYPVQVNTLNVTNMTTLRSTQSGVPRLTIGSNNEGSGTLDGTIESSVDVFKTGGGTFRVSNRAKFQSGLTVDKGTVVLASPVVPATLTLTNQGCVQVVSSGNAQTGGLMSYYYSYTSGEAAAMKSAFPNLANFEAWLSGRAISATEQTARIGTDFDYAASGSKFITAYTNADNFCVYWKGMFHAETAGTHTFATASDDGSMVWINGNVVVNNAKDQGYVVANRVFGSIDLPEGDHEIRMAFYEVGGGQGFSVWHIPPAATTTNFLKQQLLTGIETTLFSNLVSVSTNTLLDVPNAMRIVFNPARETAYVGTLTLTNPASMFVKTGEETLHVATRLFSANGAVQIANGELDLAANRGVLGSVDIRENSLLRIQNGCSGLMGEYYSYTPLNVNNTFLNFTNLVWYENYLITNSAMSVARYACSTNAGSSFNFGTTGLRFPGEYGSGSFVNFQAIWRGKIFIPVDGVYTLSTGSDDCSCLFIDGQVVVNNNYFQGFAVRSAQATLTAGAHDIALVFAQGTGGYGFTASIASSSLVDQYIPNTLLRTAGAQVSALAGSGTLVLEQAEATLDVADTADAEFKGSFAGGSNTMIIKSGVRTWTLSGDNSTFAGKWYLGSGTLVVRHASALGTGAIEVGANGTLVFDVDADTECPVGISGNGMIKVIGAGKVTLTGNTVGFNGRFDVSEKSRLSFSGENVWVDAQKCTNTVGRIYVENGAQLSFSESMSLANAIILSNATLVVTSTNTMDLYFNRLVLQAPSTNLFAAYAMGLEGEIYTLASADNAGVSNAFVSVASAYAYLSDSTKATKTGLKTVSTDCGVGFDYGDSRYGTGCVLPGGYATGKSNFAVVWRGMIRIPATGTYTFATASDDHSMLFINNSVVVNNNGPHSMQTNSASLYMLAGHYPIDVFFCQTGGDYGMRVLMQGPGDTGWTALPNQLLYLGETVSGNVRVHAAETVVTNAGIAKIVLPTGVYGISNIWVDTHAVLAVEGAVQAESTTVSVTLAEAIKTTEYTVIADFRETAGLDLTGIDLVLNGALPGYRLVYMGQTLAMGPSGTLLLLK